MVRRGQESRVWSKKYREEKWEMGKWRGRIGGSKADPSCKEICFHVDAYLGTGTGGGRGANSTCCSGRF